MNLLKHLSKILLLLLSLTITRSSIGQTIYQLPNTPYGADFCDYDLDGDNDIFISCPNSDTIVLFRNLGFGGLERIDLPFNTATFIYLDKANNDEFPDIITAFSEGIVYYLNDGNGGFDSVYHIIPRDYPNMRVDNVVDMDLNGYADILYYTFLPPYGWGIIYNNGDGTFTDDFVHECEYTERLTIDLLNGDDYPDILVSSSATLPGNYIAYNYDGVFVLDTLFDHSSAFVYNSIIDIDNDLDNDILFSAFPMVSTDRNYLFYENQDNEGFINSDLIKKKVGTRIDVITYIDGDDYKDIACVSPTFEFTPREKDSIYIFRNNQHNGFELTDQIYIGEYYGYSEMIYSGDLNGDGFPELLVTGYLNPTRHHIRILWNDGTGHYIDTNIVATKDIKLLNRKMQAHPNPFKETVTFDVDNSISGLSVISIYNMEGEKIFERFCNVNNDVQISWDGYSTNGTECHSGMYIAKLTGRNECYVVKLLKL